jgi:hypothetical protein
MTTNYGAFMKQPTRSMVLPAAIAGFILLATTSCSTDRLRERSCDDNGRVQCERHMLGANRRECAAFDAPCYGYHPTCWRPWPECCMPCPPPSQAIVPQSEQPMPGPMEMPVMPPVNPTPPPTPLPSPVEVPNPPTSGAKPEKIPQPPKPDAQTAPAKELAPKSAASTTQQNIIASAPKSVGIAATKPLVMSVDGQAATVRHNTAASMLYVAAAPVPVVQQETIAPLQFAAAQAPAGAEIFVGTLRLDSKPVTCDSPDLETPPMPAQLSYLSQSQLRIQSIEGQSQP